jgi:S-adenosylmethionine synthetase
MKYFTSEAVTEGHPDKICDQISDTLLDAILEQDPQARVAIETMVTTGLVHVAGEVTTTAYVDIPALIRQKVLAIGYDSSAKGFDGASCGISVSIGSQSPDIAQGVDGSFEAQNSTDRDVYDLQGAGDQGIMFGYATNETLDLMPTAITIAHHLATELTKARKTGRLPYLRPDGKTQVTIGYDNGIPVEVDTVVISTQHAENVTLEQIREDVTDLVITPVLNLYNNLTTKNLKIFINPTGKFVIGGPQGDAGLTGRKIIVDTYGGAARHGGGAFSGKDPSKVDRSAAYAARWVAKNVVASGLADRCEIQIAYAIGVAKPLAVYVDTFRTGRESDAVIAHVIQNVFDLRPAAIIKELNLLQPIYGETATGGHFGREQFPWEQTNKTTEIRQYLHQYLKQQLPTERI